MTIKTSRKSFIFSLILALGFILLVRIILYVINFQITAHQLSTLSVEQWQQQIKNPTQQQIILNWIERLVSMASFIVAGLIGAWRMKKKEWLFGGLTGISWQLLLLILSLGVLIMYINFPSVVFGKSFTSNQHIFQAYQKKEIIRIISGIPGTILNFSIVLTTMGGAIAYFYHQKQKR